MNFLILIISISLCACSFKGKKSHNSVQENQPINHETTEQLKSMDSDGDMINDYAELSKGLDRFVANIPKVKVNFIQDYSIKVISKKGELFTIDTKVERENPEFKYRVGELYLREHSLNNAAKLGRFSGVSWGVIKQQDFSWMSYPHVEEEFYHKKTQAYSKWLEGREVVSSSIELSNSLKLMDSSVYDAIEQLQLNFYYYSYSKEKYVLLHTQKLDQVFQKGIREEFFIKINNPPEELLQDSYLRHGEFIISEVKDFYIPKLKTSYSILLESVKSKAVPVYKSSPFENELSYVAVGEQGSSFIDIMTKLFGDKFSIVDQKLHQVEQFSNNLPAFDFLHELAGEKKSGNWFVMTNKLKQHYLKHKFKSSDALTISYIVGEDLASRVNERIYSYSKKQYSGSESKKYPIGNLYANSNINISIYLDALKGKKVIATPGRFVFSPPRCRNCTGNDWAVSAEYVTNRFEFFEGPWVIDEAIELNESLKILINNTELDMDDLIERNIATVELKTENQRQYVHYTISRINELDILQNGSENAAFIKLSPIRTDYAGEGLQINNVSGKNINPLNHAANICIQEAFKRKIKLAETSWKFDQWKSIVPWGVADQRTGWKPVKGKKTKVWDGVVVDIISTVTNNYN